MNISGREIGVFVIVVLLVLLGGLFLLGLLGALFGFGMFGISGSMMGPGMMGPGSVGPRTGLGSLGILWWLLICLVPLGILALLVVAGVWFVGRGDGSQSQPQAEVCPNCGESIQSDWKLCPHCGTSLEEDTA